MKVIKAILYDLLFRSINRVFRTLFSNIMSCSQTGWTTVLIVHDMQSSKDWCECSSISSAVYTAPPSGRLLYLKWELKYITPNMHSHSHVVSGCLWIIKKYCFCTTFVLTVWYSPWKLFPDSEHDLCQEYAYGYYWNNILQVVLLI